MNASQNPSTDPNQASEDVDHLTEAEATQHTPSEGEEGTQSEASTEVIGGEIHPGDGEVPAPQEEVAAEGTTEEPQEVPAESKEEVAEDSSDESSKTQSSAKSGKKEEEDGVIKALRQEIKGMEGAEQRIERLIGFMQEVLATKPFPHFKHFWDARRLCLPLFKERMSPDVRMRSWQMYGHLTHEAKRLREEHDQESQFAIEQIEIAVTSLEEDLKNVAQEIEAAPPVTLPVAPEAIQENIESYQGFQQELNIYNAHAARVNSLRKELMKTEMRIRFKNKFFQRLSAIGDLIFPRRKELIKEVSSLFEGDVQGFCDRYFARGEIRAPLHLLREEIKNLQSAAKELTLNTRAFTQTREKLSKCWDQIKDLDKERRKERFAKRAQFKEAHDEVEAKITAFGEEFDKGEMSINEAEKQLGEIQKFMRGVELGREEVHSLRGKMAPYREKIEAKHQAEVEERAKRDAERRAQIEALVTEMSTKVEALLEQSASMNVDEVREAKENLEKEIDELAVPKQEKRGLTKSVKKLRDVILEKQEEALLSLSTDDQEALANLKQLLSQRTQRRREVKEQLEVYRKAKGGSGFDFEKALEYEELIGEEKEKLAKCDEGIAEINAKIKELEGKVS